MTRTQGQAFWAKVSKSDGCWAWTGATRARAPMLYGDFQWRGIRVAAHRFSWELHHGEIPDGLCVLHECDNPLCVRPDHLFLGTNQDNVVDMVQKGRGRVNRQHGEGNAMVRLTEDQVREIKAAKGAIGQRRLAERFGVAVATIQMIHAGKTWSHIDVPMGGTAPHPSGEENGRAKLNMEKAEEIRSLRGVMSYVKIAERFGVSKDTVYRVMKGDVWA